MTSDDPDAWWAGEDHADGGATIWSAWPGATDDLFAGEGREHHLIACAGWQGDRWYGYAAGYRQGADAIVGRLRYEGGTVVATTDALFWPFALCWRHYAEVQLKAVLELLDQWHRRQPEVRVTHSIKLLWRWTRSSLEEAKLGDMRADLDAVARVLTQLDELDPQGMTFRYPKDRSGQLLWASTNPVNVDMRHFHHVMEGVANYLAAVETGLDVELDRRNEYEAAMWDRINDYYI